MTESKHWSKMQERGTFWGIKALLFCYYLLGRRALGVILYPVVVYLYFTGGASKKASSAYLNRVAKIQGWQESLGHKQGIKHFYTFALSAFDKMDAWTGKITTEQIRYGDCHPFAELEEKKQGAIFIGTHLGNMEVCRALSQGRYKTRINVLVFTHHAVEFNRVLQKINPDVDVDLIQVTEVGADLAIMLKQRIDDGEILVIAGDRTSTSTESRVVEVDFLGDKAPFSQGPFILSSVMNCPVYLLFCLKDKKNYRVIFEPFAKGLKFNRKTRQQELEAAVTRYAKRLEHYCLAYPYQWFNFLIFGLMINRTIVKNQWSSIKCH
jgi:predicted LPLAT superfamily acyltransferase